MVEFFLHQHEELFRELRLCFSIDVTHPNNFSEDGFFSAGAINSAFLLKNILLEKNYVVVRDVGTEDKAGLMLAKILGGNIFHQGDLGYLYGFKNHPFERSILSSSLAAGAFHTDFWARSSAPDYVLLQCVEPDPRHPYYSRNQVALVSDLLDKMYSVIPEMVGALDGIELPYAVGDKTAKVKLIDYIDKKPAMRFHPLYVADNLLDESHFFGGVPVHSLVSIFAQDVAEDFVLNSGDVLVVSNKYCLHRRGEATIKFNGGVSDWCGRKLNTLRFSF